jgi:hypothetical protein
MEEAAKTHGVACVISSDVVAALPRAPGDQLVPLGKEKIRGGLAEIPIFEYRARLPGIAKPVAGRLAIKTAAGTS